MRYEEFITLEGVDIFVVYDFIIEDDGSYIQIIELLIKDQDVYDLLDHHHKAIENLLFYNLKERQ